ncbi:hypothetical protein B0H10DRAFT_2243736 [Mycena sp. CBHHK59/15]|nr:hypothetical protein B0H10DRAFT_2243736 [Mycena sp. CBHHK59/15]
MAVPARCIQATSVAVSFLTSGATGYCLWLLTFPNMSSNSCHALILYKAPYAPEIVKPLGRGKVRSMHAGERRDLLGDAHFGLARRPLVMSYDICCQYQQNHFARQHES